MSALEELVNKIEQHIPRSEMKNTAVSQVSAGWHIAHSLLTIRVVADALIQSNPNEYKWNFNWKRSFLFATQKIPKGKIKAPKAVQPTNDLDPQSLKLQWQLTKEQVESLKQLSPGHFFKHPFLGLIKLKPAQKFLSIHTRHHLNIIEAIVKQ